VIILKCKCNQLANMSVDATTLLLAVVLPWGTGLWCIIKFNPNGNLGVWTWVGVLVFTALPFFIWKDGDENSADAVKDMLSESIDRSFDTIMHSLRYIAPFAVYPVVVFWIKLIVDYSVVHEEGDATPNHSHNKQCFVSSYDAMAQRQQARLITFVIKTIITIFVFFSVLQRVGIPTGEVLQITTVFSLGLSWSMRDWLSSLWASFMLAFTTELTCGSRLLLSSPAFGIDTSTPLHVVRTGLMYTVCVHERDGGDDTQRKIVKHIYLANSSLLTNGFTIQSHS